MQTATYTGRGNIMQAIDAVANQNPYISLWRGKDILIQNVLPDWEAAYVLLDDNLQALEQSGNKDLITIKFHPKPDKEGYITNKTPFIASMLVRVCPLDAMGGIGSVTQPGELSNAAWYALKGIKDDIAETKQTQNALMERLIAAIEAKPVEIPQTVEDDFDEVEPDIIDKIGAILEKPGVIDLVKQFAPVITGIVAKYMDVPNIAINGTNDVPANIAEKSDEISETKTNINNMANNAENIDAPATAGHFNEETGKVQQLTDSEYDQIDYVIHRLKKHTDTPILDLDALCNWVDENPVMFKGLLSSLKQ